MNVRGDVWIVQINEKGAAHPLLGGQFVERDARLSPDGRWVSYVSDESGRPEVFVRSLTDSLRREVVSRGGDQPVWARDAGALFYVSLANELHRVPLHFDRNDQVIVDAPVKLPIPPFGVRHLGTSYDVSPDARRVYFPHPGDPAKPREIGFVLDWAARLQ